MQSNSSVTMNAYELWATKTYHIYIYDIYINFHMNGLVQACSIAIANATTRKEVLAA